MTTIIFYKPSPRIWDQVTSDLRAMVGIQVAGIRLVVVKKRETWEIVKRSAWQTRHKVVCEFLLPSDPPIPDMIAADPNACIEQILLGWMSVRELTSFRDLDDLLNTKPPKSVAYTLLAACFTAPRIARL